MRPVIENAIVTPVGLRLALTSMLMLLAGMNPSILGQNLVAQISGDFPEACSRKNLEATAVVAGLAFRSYRDKGDGTACVQVLHGSKVIFQDSIGNNGYYILGQHPDPGEGWNVPPIANGTDLTGRGQPDMIVTSYSGGNHCCFSTSVFELGPTFHLLATMDGGFFSDLDHDGICYYLTDDETFAYWPSSYDDSPTEQVVLRFRNGGAQPSFRLDLDKMRKPAPTPKQWAEQLANAHETFTQDQWEQFAGQTVWQPVLDLIYTGHSNLAWKFLDEAWPPSVPEKNQWVYGFCTMLRKSPYWSGLKDTIRHPPPSCVAAEPKSAEDDAH